MKHAIKTKLHNRQGASILMALFLLVVVTVVSVVIVTVASTAAHQIRDNKEAQQAYLTVSSAAEFLRDNIDKEEYTYSYWTYTPTYGNQTQKAPGSSTTPPAGTFKSLLLSMSEAVRDDSTTVPGTTIKTKSAEISVDGMDTVNMDMYLNYVGKNENGTNGSLYYELVVKLNVDENTDKEDGYGYRMRLTIPITRMTDSKQSTYSEGNYGQRKSWIVITKTTTVSWGTGTMAKGWNDGSY